MSEFYTLDGWMDKFKPILNPNNNWGEYATYSAFETFGEDLDKVRATDVKHVWTEVDGDEGTYIIAGYSFVNRIQYYITENPWTDEWTEVPSWSYRQCDCTEETGDYDPECVEQCNEGSHDIPIDTVEDLKVLYGEDANVIA